MCFGFEFLRILASLRSGWMKTGGAKEGTSCSRAATRSEAEGSRGLAEGPRQAPSMALSGLALEGLLCVTGRCEVWICGLAEDLAPPGIVESLEAGEPAVDAKFSTSSIVRDCQPLLTLSMA